ncbi:MAG: hypothetical protein AAGI15_14725 [Pseudomonadota bacterium]
MAALRSAIGGMILLAPLCGGCTAAAEDPARPETPPASAAPAAPMTKARLGALLRQLDPDLTGQPGNWVVRVQGKAAQVITDERADRMRIMLPVDDAARLDEDALYRLLQANFESALDARYAVANGLVWSVYIHPLSPLTSRQLSLALAQTYNAAATYGTTFSSGLFQFGGGDNRDQIFDEIIDRGVTL